MYDHVLVGTDGSATATRAVRAAARLAHTHRARLTIAHAFTAKATYGTSPASALHDMAWLRSPGTTAEALAWAAADVAQAAACGALDIGIRTEVGSARAVLRALMSELDPDLVVVGNADARRSITGRGIGSALARRATADVVIVDTSEAPNARRRRRSAA